MPQNVSFERPHLGVATAALELGSQAAAGWLIGVGGGAVAQRGVRGGCGGQESVRGEGGALGGGGGEALGGGRRTRDWRRQGQSSVSNEQRSLKKMDKYQGTNLTCNKKRLNIMGKT